MRHGLVLLIFCSMPVLGAKEWAGSKACAACHAEIYRKYSRTPMAMTSGPAAAAPVVDQSFTANSGYRYSISHSGGKMFLGFSGPDTAAPERRELKYFVGSGAAARSYLTEAGGFLFESPATYYSRLKAWALSPGYGQYRYPFLTRAIAPECLLCHSSGVQAIAGTQNGYRSPPFSEDGVSCERCHGPGAAHAASGKAADIVNPSSLPQEQRDSVCAQCHLSGEIRVNRAGKSMSDFIAGKKLSDYTVAFVRDAPVTAARVTSHVENLAQSACSRASSGRLWCGTCHDPHVVPAPSEKAAWFRSRCLTCHATADCVRGPDCISCHMPRTSVADAQHVVLTDHSIPRRAAARTAQSAARAALVPFGGGKASTRDQGLAYAIVALREQNADYSKRAFDLLREAERAEPNDPQVLSYLADLYKTRGDDSTATQIYQKLYAVDRSQASGPMNLGAYRMEQGDDREAIRLFREALQISPGLVLVRMNLAVALARTGQTAQARSELETALQFNPAFKAARDLLNRLP